MKKLITIALVLLTIGTSLIALAIGGYPQQNNLFYDSNRMFQMELTPTSAIIAQGQTLTFTATNIQGVEGGIPDTSLTTDQGPLFEWYVNGAKVKSGYGQASTTWQDSYTFTATTPGTYTIDVILTISIYDPFNLHDIQVIGHAAVTVTQAPSAQVTFNTYGSGSINPPVGTYTYLIGQTIPLSASPWDSYAFAYWQFDNGTQNANPNLNLYISQDITATAYFVSAQIPITVQNANPNMGYISPIGTNTYAVGALLTLTATANYGYKFSYWSFNDGTPTSPLPNYAFTIRNALTATAHFELDLNTQPTPIPTWTPQPTPTLTPTSTPTPIIPTPILTPTPTIIPTPTTTATATPPNQSTPTATAPPIATLRWNQLLLIIGILLDILGAVCLWANKHL